jgi:hypothetical protein
MAGAPNRDLLPDPLAHSQSTHNAQICTTAGASILFLQEKIQAEFVKLSSRESAGAASGVVDDIGLAGAGGPGFLPSFLPLVPAKGLTLDWLTKSPVLPEDLACLGVREYFDEKDGINIIYEKLPEIYRMGGTSGKNLLMQGSLQGLRTLRGWEEKLNPGEPVSEEFKSFAIGVFLENKYWDLVAFNGQIIEVSLDRAFACITYALNDEASIPLEALAGRTPWEILYEEIHRDDTPLLKCSTGRRNHLVSILGGQLQYPGILLFARDAEFIDRAISLKT